MTARLPAPTLSLRAARSRALALATFLVVAAPMSAQDSVPPIPRVVQVLPPLSVLGSEDRRHTIPGAAVVLDARELRQRQPRNLNDALRSVPGDANS